MPIYCCDAQRWGIIEICYIVDSNPLIFQGVSHTGLRIRPFQRSLRRPGLRVPLRVVEAWQRARGGGICKVSHEETVLIMPQEISDLPLTSYLFTGSPSLVYTLSKRTRQWSVRTIPLWRKGGPTQVSTLGFSTFRDPFPLITTTNRQVDSCLGVAGFTQRPEQWTEAARPEELVGFAVDVQRVWCYAFCAVHRPMQTNKTSVRS